MAARVAVGLVAVFALGWLAVMERNVRLEERGRQASGRLAVAGNEARAEAAFRDARFLNPDTAPDLGRAVLYLVTRGHAPATARRALAARRRLDPLSARQR